MNTPLILQRLHELRQRLERANYTDFRAVDYITEIQAAVKQSSSQPLPAKTKPSEPNDLTSCESKECKEDL